MHSLFQLAKPEIQFPLKSSKVIKLFERRENPKNFSEALLKIKQLEDLLEMERNNHAISKQLLEKTSVKLSLLKKQALTDSMTGLYNRRYIEELSKMIKEAGEKIKRIAFLAIIDIDNLKKFNDCLGHDGGDDLINFFADVIRGFVNEIKVAARIGGDEFVIMGFMENHDEAELFGRQLQEKLSSIEYVISGITIKVSASCGFATKIICNDFSFDALYKDADRRMYQRKKQKKRFNLKLIEEIGRFRSMGQSAPLQLPLVLR